MRRIEAVMACRERLELNVAPLLAVEEMTLALAAGQFPRARAAAPLARASWAGRDPGAMIAG